MVYSDPMLPEEMLRVGLFLLAICCVYAVAGLFLIEAVLRRARKVPPSSGRIRFVRRGAYLAAGAGVLCFAWGLFVEPYWPEVRRVTVPSPKVPAGSRGIRIVHISDLHCDPEPRLEERLPGIIAAERPDLIVFTGDALNSPAGLPIFQRCMRELSAVAPLFCVKGNWDSAGRGRGLFDGTGARELDGRLERVDVGGIPVQVCGMAFGREAKIPSLLREARREELTVFLHHYPDEIHAAAEAGVDLYCAGHTHGGQVALPFYGALVTLSRFGKRFEGGLYQVGGTWLNVNRGIGMEGGRAPRVRFCARPEVTVIEVVPAGP